MKYFVANWKANKNLKEAKEWLNEFLKLYQPQENKMVIICPPFPLLTELRDKIYKVKNLKLGSQDLSSFEEGPYTGEVTAKTLQGIVDYALVGHSERRKYFKESSEIISKKIVFAKKYQIEPILCLSQENDWQDNNLVKIVVYEPIEAIGSGNNESPEKVIAFKEKIKLSVDNIYLYGGSVNQDNAKSYTQSDKIDGLLVGGSSLDPLSFFKIIG